ncbi:MAG: hypothetical protein FWG94_11320 [Oscillospiraceae bacterium]|nr:hypothetical protein [Oscillospiraceae bacterium]
MKVLRIEQIVPSEHGLFTVCDIHLIHILVDDLDNTAKSLIEIIKNTSWISELFAINQESYNARAEKTIKKLVEEIFSQVDSSLSEGFGEYMVSLKAQDVLEQELLHSRIPLAELFKEKVIGNPGFDFHMETHKSLIAFGEAKYSGSSTPYKKALTQIHNFIVLKKDTMELSDLQHFASSSAATSATNGSRAYIAAFSLNGKRYDQIFKNLLSCNEINAILNNAELYLIGVTVKSD